MSALANNYHLGRDCFIKLSARLSLGRPLIERRAFERWCWWRNEAHKWAARGGNPSRLELVGEHCDWPTRATLASSRDLSKRVHLAATGMPHTISDLHICGD